MADIEIKVEGIIAMLFRKDADGKLIECVLGVVNGVPKHELEIKYKKNAEAEVTIDPTVPKLKLTVEKTSTTGIRLFKPQMINRVTLQGDQASSSWILDFELELYKRDIGVDMTKFRHVFRINNGEIFTREISANHLLSRSEADPHEPLTLIGRVATRFGIRTDLDQTDSKAVLSNDAGTIVELKKTDKLEMKVGLVCPTCEHTGQDTGHANNYYKAMGQKLAFGEKLLFSSTKMPLLGTSPPIAPEASCLPGRLGSSNPGGG